MDDGVANSKCQVIFFPLRFAQSFENLQQLDRIQREIRRALWDLDASHRHSSKYDFAVAKQKFHKHIRNSIEIVKDA